MFLSDGRSVPGHRDVEASTGPHDSVHEICLHTASGPQPFGQSALYVYNQFVHVNENKCQDKGSRDGGRPTVSQ